MKTVTAELPSPKVTSCSQIDVQPSKPYLNQANKFEAFMKLDWRLLDKNQAGLNGSNEAFILQPVQHRVQFPGPQVDGLSDFEIVKTDRSTVQRKKQFKSL